MGKSTLTINNLSRALQPAGQPENGDTLLARPAPSQSAGSGLSAVRIRNPEHRAKAVRFWDNLAAKRKLPGHCCRCGKPHGGEFRQCDPCRVRVANAKARRQTKELTLAHCVVMVKQCRKETTKLRMLIKQMQTAQRRDYTRGYQRGIKTGREQGRYGDTIHSLTAQELSQISHRYQNER